MKFLLKALISKLPFAFCLSLSVTAMALPVTEAAPEDRVPASPWQLLLERIQQDGKLLELETADYLYLQRKKIINPEPNHQDDYISLVGSRSETGDFRPYKVEAVSESWIKNKDGNWSIDQWLFRIELDQTLTAASHYWMLQTPERRVLESKFIPESAAASLRQWQSNKEFWTGPKAKVHLPAKSSLALAIAGVRTPSVRAQENQYDW